jgi:glycogen operon protein
VSQQVRCLGVRLSGDAIQETDERGERVRDDTMLVLLNAQDGPVPFTLPALGAEQRWVTVMDTAREERDHRRLLGGDAYLLEGRSLAVLRRGRSRPTQPPPNGPE